MKILKDRTNNKYVIEANVFELESFADCLASLSHDQNQDDLCEETLDFCKNASEKFYKILDS